MDQGGAPEVGSVQGDAPSADTALTGWEGPDARSSFLANAVAAAGTHPVAISIRDLLALWGARRRGYLVVSQVTRALQGANLMSDPPFTQGAIDDKVTLLPLEDSRRSGASPAIPRRSVSLQIGSLPSATHGLTSVTPQDTIQRAQTVMLLNDFSQLGVMQSAKSAPLAVTWESVAKALIRDPNAQWLHQALVEAPVVWQDADLLEAIPAIVHVGFVFVARRVGESIGVVTTADLSRQFADLAGPFILLSEIELRLRQAIGGALSLSELAKAAEPDAARQVESVDDLSLGEIIRLLEPEVQWARLNWHLDRKEFLQAMHHVRELRNDVMHFSPDPLAEGDLQALRAFLTCLRTLQPRD